MKVSIITISDSVSRGAHDDGSGDAIAAWAIARGDVVVSRVLVADESTEIVRALLAACDSGESDVVLTTGGTGLSERDVTPEATRAVIDAEVQGFGEQLRSHAARFPRAALSRGIAGIRARTLIVNLPGSPSGVRDGLGTLDQIVDHACDVLRGRVGQHGSADGA
ncbi:MAG: MogA/MoaB family molybdenum cofactor biosynthesis protein [Gemmatimonadota bacterium]|nr:MogA/MoaB family molybdenum cofactor biosynthesis protein [Gemmatimonadota bacterium]